MVVTDALTRPDPRAIDRLARPIRAFLRHRVAGGLLLLGAALIGLIWANSRWHHLYEAILHAHLSVDMSGARLSKPLEVWINDALMAVFFFLVGLEIKREILGGELSTWRKAALPAIAAAGGMLVPAGVYLAFNFGRPALHGWGIPMATDIAFALGVLALLGDRIPRGLRAFLTALAIADDIGAVLVIAIFYTGQVSTQALAIGLLLFAIAIAANLLHVRSQSVYAALGIAVWLAFLESGVHATVGALLIAFTIPARTRLDGDALLHNLRTLITRLHHVGVPKDRRLNTHEQQRVLEQIETTVDQASAPLQQIEDNLSGFVTFAVLPIFALANAGVVLGAGALSADTHSSGFGIMAGLVIGKPLGIAGATWLALKLGLSDLPKGVRFQHIVGVGFLGGIGFTMALFISALAFAGNPLLPATKLAVLTGSLVSGVAGWTVLRFTRIASEAGTQRVPP